MNNCTMLKWARREMGLTQKQLGDAIGISSRHICTLELHSSAWHTLTNPTKEKLNNFFKDTKYWDQLNLDLDGSDLSEDDEKTIEETVDVEPVEIEVHKVEKADKNVKKDYDNVLTLIEFVYEGLKESKTHEDFVVNINMLKRIIKKYGF